MLAWASLRPANAPPTKIRPSQDPDRKEMLMISLVRLTEGGGYEVQGELVEILRNRDRTVHDLLQLPTPQSAEPGNEDPMLLSFIKGFKSGNAPPEPPPQRFDPKTGEGRHGKPPRKK